MNTGLIADSVIVILSVAVTIILYVRSKNKVAIDKKAMRGDVLAKTEKMIANSVKTIVYQTEREDGSGRDKLLTAFNYLIVTLDLAHLPHPSTAYIKGKIEKSVTMARQTRNFVDSMQTLTKEDDIAEQLEGKTIVSELKGAKR